MRAKTRKKSPGEGSPDSLREGRRQKILKALKGLVPDILKRYESITTIWVVGSIAVPIFFDMRSDVDIVVDGLPKDKYFEMMSYLERQLNEKVDLILMSDLENANKRIIEKRIVIYEKDLP